MATHHGREGVVKVGSNTVAEVTSFTINETAQVIDDSALTDEWDTHLLGTKSWDAELTAHWDETDTTGQGALTIGASVTLNLYPEGATTGDVYYTGTATVVSISRSVARNQTITATIRCQGSGALTQSTA